MDYQMPVTVKNDRMFTLKHACFMYFVGDIRPVIFDALEELPLLKESIFKTHKIQENSRIRSANYLDKSLYSFEITNIKYEKVENFNYMEREKMFSKPKEKTISLGYKTTFDIEIKISEKVKFSDNSLIISFHYPDKYEFGFDDVFNTLPRMGRSKVFHLRCKYYMKRFIPEEYFFKMNFIPLGISEYPYSPVNKESYIVKYKVKVNNFSERVKSIDKEPLCVRTEN